MKQFSRFRTEFVLPMHNRRSAHLRRWFRCSLVAGIAHAYTLREPPRLRKAFLKFLLPPVVVAQVELC